MYLENVLGSKTKVNILAVLVQSPDQGIIESSLAKKAGSSVSEVNRQITDLVTIGLVSLTRVGRSKQYRVNTRHFLYLPLSNLFRSLDSVYMDIAEKVKGHALSISPVDAVILIGSTADGTIRQDYVSNPSDIDIVFVLDDPNDIPHLKENLLRYTSGEIFHTYGVNAYSIVLSKTEYIQGLSDDRFIMNVHTNGKLLHGKRPSRFSQMGPAKSGPVP